MRSFPSRTSVTGGASAIAPLLLRVSGLVALFCISFSLPILAMFKTAHYIFPSRQEAPQTDLFPNGVRIHLPGSYVRVAHDPAFSLSSLDDTLVVAWFRLSKLPEEGQRMALFSKIAGQSPAKEGYSLSLTRDNGVVRPVLYWRGRNGKGGWYWFSEPSIQTRQWFMMALSLRAGKFLGLHIGFAGDGEEKPRIELLGGYELEPGITPYNESDLAFGAFGQNPMRGAVGPIAIISHPEIGEHFKETLKVFVADPNNLPSNVSEDSVKLWAPQTLKDISASGHLIELRGNSERARGAGGAGEHTVNGASE